MGRGRKLSPEHQISIINFMKANWSVSKIAKEIGNSKTAVANYIKAKNKTTSIQKPPVRTKSSSTQRRALIREASKSNKTARHLKAVYNLRVGIRKV